MRINAASITESSNALIQFRNIQFGYSNSATCFRLFTVIYTHTIARWTELQLSSLNSID